MDRNSETENKDFFPQSIRVDILDDRGLLIPRDHNKVLSPLPHPHNSDEVSEQRNHVKSA